MIDKYYTPEIEDFYPGYKYEYKTHDGVNYSKEDFDKKPWIEGIYGFSDFPYVERTMKGRMQHQTVRTKYLCQEDIESLGWECLPQYKSSFEKDNYILTLLDDKIEIWVKDLIKYDPTGETTNGTIFLGKAKSINELRKILEWIL